MDFQCTWCRRVVEMPRHLAARRKYCCLKCSHDSQRGVSREQEPGNEQHCEWCKKLFWVRVSKPRRYCCWKCHVLSRRQNPPSFTCEQCGKVVVQAQWLGKRADRTQRFCSWSCVNHAPRVGKRVRYKQEAERLRAENEELRRLVAQAQM